MTEISFDKKDHFKNPVSKNDVPDYFDIIKNPMCWTMIDAKINKFEYWDFQAFRVRCLCFVFLDILCAYTCHRMMLNLLSITPFCIINQGLSSIKMLLAFKRNRGPFLTPLKSWSLSMTFLWVPMLMVKQWMKPTTLIISHLLATSNRLWMYLNSSFHPNVSRRTSIWKLAVIPSLLCSTMN